MKAKAVWISERDFMAILRGELRVSRGSLPDDVVFDRATYDFNRSAFGVRILSETFPESIEGCELEWFVLQLEDVS